MVESLNWHQASTIKEFMNERPHGENQKKGKLRMSRWRQLSVFKQKYSDEDLALSPLGVTAESLEKLLGTDPNGEQIELENQTPPDWFLKFDQWLKLSKNNPDTAQNRNLELLEVAFPLISGARIDLLEQISTIVEKTPPHLREIVSKLAGSITDEPPIDELANIVMPTLILELNVAREEGRLKGNGPNERYNDFVATVGQDSTRDAIFAEYSVMARLLATRLTFWQERSVQIVQDFSNDLDEMASTFFNGELPNDIYAEFGKGDSHNRGRSVALITTNLGRLVYKPRSTNVDSAFDKIINWFNDQNPELKLSSPTHLGDQTHGWFQHVDGTTIADDTGADRFAWRLGALTALLYFVQATDFHFENIVAVGDMPIAVDVETLLHTDKLGALPKPEFEDNVGAAELIESVWSIGILPSKIITGEGNEMRATDVSALGGSGGQQSVLDVPMVQEFGTDAMHVIKQATIIDDQLNRPAVSEGQTAHDLLTRHDDFSSGFDWAYSKVIQNKDTWICDGGLIDNFSNAFCRIVVRPTMIYGRLLLESYHPDFMRNGLDRDLCLSKLLVGYYGQDRRDSMISAEMIDVIDGDVPFFEVEATTGAVLHGSTRRIVDVLPVSPIDRTKQKILSVVGNQDKTRQLRVIASCFDAATLGSATGLGSPQVLTEEPPPTTNEQKLSAATRITDRLIDTSLNVDGRRGWISISFLGEKWWTVVPLGTDLYTGVPGLALALASVAESTSNDSLHAEARRIFLDLAKVGLSFERFDEEASNNGLPRGVDVGGYGSVSGFAYSLAMAYAWYGDNTFANAVDCLMKPMLSAAKSDKNYDVVAGSAGAIMAAISIASAVPSAPVRDIVSTCVEKLVNAAIHSDDTVSWPAAGGGTPLVGFSHGALGVAVALTRLRKWDGTYAATVDPLIKGALAFEQKYSVADTGDWIDLRADSTGEAPHMRAWCHGSAGAILGRSELLKSPFHGSSKTLAQEIAVGLRATIESTQIHLNAEYGQGNQSICHGDIGNLLCAEETLRAIGDSNSYDLQIAQTWAGLMKAADVGGWRCSSPSAVETPGLMTGLAGIAWGLAYSCCSDKLPNLMVLEGPEKLLQRASRYEQHSRAVLAP